MIATLAPTSIRRTTACKMAVVTSRQPAEDSNELPALLEPWMDMRQKVAIYCTRHLMGIRAIPNYAVPSVPLQVFIEHILKHSSAPLTAAAGALAVIDWLSTLDKSLISSSPHHLFLSAYLIVVKTIWGIQWDEEDWVEMTNGHIPRSEIFIYGLERARDMVAGAELSIAWNVKWWTAKDIATEFREVIWEMSVEVRMLGREGVNMRSLKVGRQSQMLYDMKIVSGKGVPASDSSM